MSGHVPHFLGEVHYKLNGIFYILRNCVPLLFRMTVRHAMHATPLISIIKSFVNCRILYSEKNVDFIWC